MSDNIPNPSFEFIDGTTPLYCQIQDEAERIIKQYEGHTITWYTGGGLSGKAIIESIEVHDSGDCDCDECRKDRGQ